MNQSRREFVRTLFVATQGIVASQLLPTDVFAETTPASPADKPLNFLVVGDWGRRGNADQLGVAQAMARTAGSFAPQFIISVGDNFYDDGVASVDDPHWQESFEKVYAAPTLQVPWHVALGNHDYHGNCDAQLEYARAHHRWQMPARYFTKIFPVTAETTVEFFYLDTTPMIKSYHLKPETMAHVATQNVPAQLAWFEKALAESKAQWKIVIGHHPIYSGGEHGDTKELIRDILPLLHQHKVQAYFNGHDHDLQHLMAGKVNLFDSGAGSEVRPTNNTPHTRFSKTCSGFTAVSLLRDAMRVQMIDRNGTLLYTATVNRTA